MLLFLLAAILLTTAGVLIQAETEEDYVHPVLVEELSSIDTTLSQQPFDLDSASGSDESDSTLLQLSATPIWSTGRNYRRHGCVGPNCKTTRKHGWGINADHPPRPQQRLPHPRLTGAASTLTRANVRCVLCQYITQRIKKQLQPTGPASLLETFSFTSIADQARIEAEVSATASADATANQIPALFEDGPDQNGRQRQTDILANRDKRARFTQTRAIPNDAQRAAYLTLYSSVYSSFENLCAKRMPLAYLPYCNDMLKSYRFFAQGINYGDRADQICMNGNFCDARSYVRTIPHTVYQREPGDA